MPGVPPSETDEETMARVEIIHSLQAIESGFCTLIEALMRLRRLPSSHD